MSSLETEIVVQRTNLDVNVQESTNIDVAFADTIIETEFVVEQTSLDVNIQPRIELEVLLAPAQPGGGDVQSVNGQTGIVILDANDVGADPIGSAAQALTDANIYTDQELANLDFLESVVAGAGVTVDNTDPQNPIISATALPQQIYLFQNQEYTSTFVYVGYKAIEGDWYIYRRTRATNARQYAFGISDYSTNWTNRASLIYA